MSRTWSVSRLTALLAALMLVIACCADAAEDAAANSDKVPVDGPVLAPFHPPYASQAKDPEGPAAAPPSADTPSVDGPALSLDDPQAKPAPKADDAKPDNTATTEGKADTATKEPAEKTADKADTATKEPAEKTADEAPPTETPRRELTPAEIGLRDRVRRTLAYHFNQPLSADANHVGEVVHACRAFGCRTEVIRGGTKINAVTALCWNYACGGFEPLAICDGHIAARVGYGRQERPGEMLAAFALARLPANYPMRVGENVRNVADFVEYEKLTCRSGDDLSLKLTGLSWYVGDQQWKNDLGETWTLERIIAEEIDKPVVSSPDGGTTRLMGLAAAVAGRQRRGEPLEGQFARAAKFTEDFQEFAFQLQGTDGSWSPQFFAARGTGRDPSAQLRSCGRIVEWLAFSLPDEQLGEPRMLKAVEYVTGLLASSRYQSAQVRSMNSREIASVMHALHGLSIYDERYFKPADPPPAEKPAESPPPRQAGGSTGRPAGASR